MIGENKGQKFKGNEQICTMDLQGEVIPTSWGVTDLPVKRNDTTMLVHRERPTFAPIGPSHCREEEEEEAYLALGFGIVSGLTHTWRYWENECYSSLLL